jgi:DNA repair exonuclease SbcCD ATPase subunit
MELADYRAYIEREKGKRSVIETQLNSNRKRKQFLELRTKAVIEAQVLIQQTAVETQQLIKVHLEDIVNKVLQTCFPEYTFDMKYDIKRNKSECSLHFYCNGNETDLLDGDSGGALNTACIALRIAVWTIGNADNCLVLDEAFANLDINRQPLMGQILQELSKELGVQIVLVSHSPAMDVYADRVYTVTKTNGISKVA